MCVLKIFSILKKKQNLWVSKKIYVKKVLEKFGMENAKPISIPLVTNFRLWVSQYPKLEEEIEDM